MSSAADNRLYRQSPPDGHVVGEFVPAVDRNGDEVWLSPEGIVEWVNRADGDQPETNWVQLYRPAPAGEVAA